MSYLRPILFYMVGNRFTKIQKNEPASIKTLDLCEYRGGPGPGLSFSGWQDLRFAIKGVLEFLSTFGAVKPA